MNDSEHFQNIRDLYFEPKSEWATSRIRRVLDGACLRPGERVLDLACAFGTFSFHARIAGANPIGLDRNESSLKSGREISRRVGGFTTPRVIGDACYLPFRSGSFDLIINADFIEHTPDNVKSLIFREMYRVTRRGGRGVVYSPNLNRVRWELFGERIKRWIGLRPTPVPHWRDFVDADHFGLTTPWKAAFRLRRAGFVTDIHYYEFHVPLLSRIAGFNMLFRRLLSPQFANRFLIRLRK